MTHPALDHVGVGTELGGGGTRARRVATRLDTASHTAAAPQCRPQVAVTWAVSMAGT